jgi:2-polyprenyl-3-methyl-5-hydroxy-6-metoxy-1,4-benzoquinol methylase
MSICPICSGTSFAPIASRERLEQECRVRATFVNQRLSHPVTPNEAKDLTDFFHAEKAEIEECKTCSLLIRTEYERPPAEDYSKDDYDPEVIEREYPEYVAAFRRKEGTYRELLPSGARVLEVGSHYGAFLQVAAEWGWRAEGVDVGKDTSSFACSKGFLVQKVELQDAGFPEETFDAVFIWNCFEQIEQPKPLLQACRRVLKPGGLLTLRTPNGLFYSICQSLLSDGTLNTETEQFLVDAMGYNNLLGFPYLYGHNRATLQRLVEPYGFRIDGFLNSELLTLPVPDKSRAVQEEERAINKEMRMLANSIISDKAGVLAGPWIEVWFRRQ